MVNIFGIKLFEGSSIDKQMHYKSRKGTKRHHIHGPDCLDCTKKHKHGPNCYNCNKSSRKRYKGGYVYTKKGAKYEDGEEGEEEDVTMSLASKSKSKTKSRRHKPNSNENSK